MSIIQQIKNIIATFLKVKADSINNDTVIDRSAIKGSIMIHRMYAALSRDLKFEIKDYSKIKTLGDLLKVCGLKFEENKKGNSEKSSLPQHPVLESGKIFSVGIDIEEVNKMPSVPDFREDVFYKQNFSQKEISYCLLQINSLQSFAGKFSAKEAIVKADNSYKGIPFSQIEIDTDASGKPYFKNFLISISHTDNLAIAVAIKIF